VVARTIISGSQGKGIVLLDPRKDGYELFNNTTAKLYTKFVKSTSEWRVHAFATGETLCAKKALREGQHEDETPIRNHGDKYTFKYKDLNVRDGHPIRVVSVAAVRALGLDFGACDVLYDTETGVASVVEVNTAPGLDHSVPLDWYTERFTKWMEGR
jgi:glutathione synthase/RimK-type ligase-like ATP-grasp enzyme